MTSPHYINEDKSDMRGIKHGWYAVEDDGNLSSGPFSLEECVKSITQPTNGTMRRVARRQAPLVRSSGLEANFMETPCVAAWRSAGGCKKLAQGGVERSGSDRRPSAYLRE